MKYIHGFIEVNARKSYNNAEFFFIVAMKFIGYLHADALQSMMHDWYNAWSYESAQLISGSYLELFLWRQFINAQINFITHFRHIENNNNNLFNSVVG